MRNNLNHFQIATDNAKIATGAITISLMCEQVVESHWNVEYRKWNGKNDNWWTVIPGVVVVVVVITCDEYEASKPDLVFCPSVMNVM